MLRIVKKYHKNFKLENSKGFKQKAISALMLTLPHILTVLIFILLFPEKTISILIVGLILPDFSYFFHMFIHPAASLKGNKNLEKIGRHRKTVAHILTAIVLIFLFAYQEWIVSSAGAIHLFLDFLGF